MQWDATKIYASCHACNSRLVLREMLSVSVYLSDILLEKVMSWFNWKRMPEFMEADARD